jgi:predicted Rossmann fold nucleotide-binding protein DprA/Smf involved in DNA uptake
MKGTGGKPQNADAYILMERNGDLIKVLVSSKETDKKPRFRLHVSPEGSGEEKFQYAGDLEEASADMKAKGETNRNLVYEAVGPNWTSKAEVKTATGLSSSTVSDHLAFLHKEGKVEKTGENRATRYRRPSDGNKNLTRTVE